METELCLPKTEHPVWFLKVDSFLLHGTSLWTPVSASSAEPQGVQVGFWIRVATFNGTLWFNWEFSALWLEDVKVALSERHKGPMYGVRLMRGRIRTVPGMYQPGSPSGLELTATRDMENKLPHTHTHTLQTCNPSQAQGFFGKYSLWFLSPFRWILHSVSLPDPQACPQKCEKGSHQSDPKISHH